jgi:hypothetical protein
MSEIRQGSVRASGGSLWELAPEVTMPTSHALFVALLSSAFALSQTATAASTDVSSVRTTLPIVFTNTVRADRSRPGDIVHARTTQAARLASGEVIPAGTEVVGHVAAANAFVYDKTPYARQRESVLEIRFDSLHLASGEVPLQVTVRAMADPLTTWAARVPNQPDDSTETVTQVGGDQLSRAEAEVVDRNGDVVAYNRRGGIFAHLIARAGCDESTNEVLVDIFSASACGLYGFTGVTSRVTGSSSTLSLVSTHTSPTLWRHSTALLETLPDAGVAH